MLLRLSLSSYKKYKIKKIFNPLFLIRNYDLVMKQGNKVQATIYAQDIQAFQDKFQLSKTYLVSNAQVRFTKSEYRAIAGDVQWTINGRTRVEEVEETHTGILFSTYKFAPFDKLQDHMDHKYSEISIFLQLR